MNDRPRIEKLRRDHPVDLFDCGQEALLFITLCRLNGIPAHWETGWTTGPDKNMHDWCEIYLAPYGWVPADVSYGLVNSEQEREKFADRNQLDEARSGLCSAIIWPRHADEQKRHQHWANPGEDRKRKKYCDRIDQHVCDSGNSKRISAIEENTSHETCIRPKGSFDVRVRSAGQRNAAGGHRKRTQNKSHHHCANQVAQRSSHAHFLRCIGGKLKDIRANGVVDDAGRESAYADDPDELFLSGNRIGRFIPRSRRI
jgi:hypothetical protein